MAITVPLKSLYVKGDRDSTLKLLESLSHFRCKFRDNNMELEEYLKKKAIEFEDRNLNRTYLVLDETVDEILGYFTICMKVLGFGDKVSKSKRDDLTSGSKEQFTPSLLIAHMGKSEKCNDRLRRCEILDTAISYIKRAHEIVGGRIILVECDKDNHRLKKYYTDNGFKILQENTYTELVMKL